MTLRKRLGLLYRRAMRRTLLARASRFALTRRPALVLAPHPDDETLGCGGLIAAKRAVDVPVTVLVLTDGGGDGRDPALPAKRQREALAALHVLGVPADAVHFLGWPDGGLAALSEPARARLRGQLAAHLRPGMELFVPHRRDGSPDHEAVWPLVRTLPLDGLQVLEYVTWSLTFRPRRLGAMRLLRHGRGAQKREAMRQHASQRGVSPELLACCLRDFEFFA